MDSRFAPVPQWSRPSHVPTTARRSRSDSSLRALEKIGFRRDGLLRSWHVHRGERRDVVILSLLREEWERSPLAAVGVRVLR